MGFTPKREDQVWSQLVVLLEGGNEDYYGRVIWDEQDNAYYCRDFLHGNQDSTGEMIATMTSYAFRLMKEHLDKAVKTRANKKKAEGLLEIIRPGDGGGLDQERKATWRTPRSGFYHGYLRCVPNAVYVPPFLEKSLKTVNWVGNTYRFRDVEKPI